MPENLVFSAPLLSYISIYNKIYLKVLVFKARNSEGSLLVMINCLVRICGAYCIDNFYENINVFSVFSLEKTTNNKGFKHGCASHTLFGKKKSELRNGFFLSTQFSPMLVVFGKFLNSQ